MKHQPRKRFGQNFLTDQSVVERIVSSMQLSADDAVIEVGPGLGALTLPLLKQLQKLTVIEIDRDLIARLAQQSLNGLHIHEGDALSTDYRQFHTGQALRLVGNLPYNIGTPLLLRWLDIHLLVEDIHVMLQKEVVDRLNATSGSRAYGRLTVLMQSVFSVQPLFTVPATAFNPQPKIQSAVVRLRPRSDAPSPETLLALQNATRLAFANKRKTLRNNLKLHLSNTELEAIGIDPQARAETLDLNAFIRLASCLEAG